MIPPSSVMHDIVILINGLHLVILSVWSFIQAFVGMGKPSLGLKWLAVSSVTEPWMSSFFDIIVTDQDVHHLREVKKITIFNQWLAITSLLSIFYHLTLCGFFNTFFLFALIR